MIKIALTGGIGAGKSAALKIFAELNCSVQDCDDVVYEIYDECPEFKQALMEHFGPRIFSSGQADKKKIAAIVFQQSEELRWLNEQLHPRVRQMVQQRYCPDKLNIVAVPLLHEAGWHRDFDKSICVWCPDDLRLQRLVARGLSRTEALRRIAVQMPQDEKLQKSDFALINDANLAHLKSQCNEIFNELF